MQEQTTGACRSEPVRAQTFTLHSSLLSANKKELVNGAWVRNLTPGRRTGVLLPGRASEHFLGKDASTDNVKKKPVDSFAPGFDIREWYAVHFSGPVFLPIVLITYYLQCRHKTII